MKEQQVSDNNRQDSPEGFPQMGSRRRFIKTSAGAMLVFGAGLSIPEADAANAGLTGTGTGDFYIISVDFTWTAGTTGGGNITKTVTIHVKYHNSSGVTRLFEWGWASSKVTPKLQLPVTGAAGSEATKKESIAVSHPSLTEIDFWGSGSGYDANLDDVWWDTTAAN